MFGLINMKINRIIQIIFSYFRTVYVFESKRNISLLKYKNFKLKKYNSLKLIKNKFLVSSLKKNKKDNRFKKNQNLIALLYKKKIVCTGWMHEGNDWLITEINKKINIKGKILLYDFFTLPNFRNRSFYTKILNLIKNHNTKSSFIIYCLKNNNSSKKGILNSKFKLVDKMKKNVFI